MDSFENFLKYIFEDNFWTTMIIICIVIGIIMFFSDGSGISGKWYFKVNNNTYYTPGNFQGYVSKGRRIIGAIIITAGLIGFVLILKHLSDKSNERLKNDPIMKEFLK